MDQVIRLDVSTEIIKLPGEEGVVWSFPIEPAFAMTPYSLQGQRLDRLRILATPPAPRRRGFDGQTVVAVCSAVTSFSRVRWLGGSGFDLEAFLLQNFKAGERRSAEIIKWTSRYVKGRWMD